MRANVTFGESAEQGLSQDMETGCPNGGFIDFWVSKVLNKVHTTNEIILIYLQILLFNASNCFACIVGVTLHALSSRIVIISKSAPAAEFKRKSSQLVPKSTLTQPNPYPLF